MTSLLVALPLVWAGFAIALFLLQDRLLFQPVREVTRTPGSVGLAFEDVVLPLDGGDGIRRIHGWFVPAPHSRGTLLFAHGNAGNISGRLESIGLFVGLGMDVLIFDYEGYGKSTGRPGEAALYRDMEAAWNHLTRERSIAPDRIVLFGRSLGGAPAAWLASRVDAGGLVLESSFTSLATLAREKYPLFVVPGMVRHKLDTLASVRDARCPVLVAHSEDDDLVPFHHGRKLFGAAPEPRFFLTMKGDHNSGPATTGAGYTDALDRFLRRVLGQ